MREAYSRVTCSARITSREAEPQRGEGAGETRVGPMTRNAQALNVSVQEQCRTVDIGERFVEDMKYHVHTQSMQAKVSCPGRC